MDIEGAVEYPTNDEDWLTTALIGGGILIAGMLVMLGVFFVGSVLAAFTFGIGFLFVVPVVLAVQAIVGAPVLGHYVEVLRRTMRGEEDPPRFDDLGDRFVDGLYATAIAFVYQIPGIVVFGGLLAAGLVLWLLGIGIAGVGGSGEAASAITVLGFGLLYVVGFVGAIVWNVYLLATVYLIPISVCSYARTGDFWGSFDRDHLQRVATSSEYAVAMLVVLGGGAVLNQFVGFLNLLLVGFFIQFYIGVVGARIVGQAYADAAGIEPDAPTRDPTVDRPGEGAVGGAD